MHTKYTKINYTLKTGLEISCFLGLRDEKNQKQNSTVLKS